MKRTFIIAAALVLSASLARAQALDESLLAHFAWRSVGPAGAGGRVVDVAVGGQSSERIYVAFATGGVWTSANEGTSWQPIFDHEGVASVGDIAVDPSNPDTIWVGTGEVNPRNSVSWGDGVYKSADGGKTWTNTGLKDTLHIGRVIVDPRESEHGLRRRARAHVGTEQGARRLQDDRRRPDVDARACSSTRTPASSIW